MYRVEVTYVTADGRVIELIQKLPPEVVDIEHAFLMTVTAIEEGEDGWEVPINAKSIKVEVF